MSLPSAVPSSTMTSGHARHVMLLAECDTLLSLPNAAGHAEGNTDRLRARLLVSTPEALSTKELISSRSHADSGSEVAGAPSLSLPGTAAKEKGWR